MPYTSLDRSGAAAPPTTDVGDPTFNNGMTLLQMQQELSAMLIGRTDVLPARLRLFINQAYTDMVTSLKIDEMRASIDVEGVAEQYLYRLPYAVFAIERVALLDPVEDPIEGGRPLEKSDLSAFRAQRVQTGPIRTYFRHTDMLVTWPTLETDATLSVDFWIRPTWMTEDTQCPLLNVEWHEGLLLLARHKALGALQEWEAAQIAQNDYVNFVRRRLDTSVIEDDNKVVRSSVPRSSSQLARPRSLPPQPWREW